MDGRRLAGFDGVAIDCHGSRHRVRGPPASSRAGDDTVHVLLDQRRTMGRRELQSRRQAPERDRYDVTAARAALRLVHISQNTATEVVRMASRRTTQPTARPRTRRSTPAIISDGRPDAFRLYPTKNDLPENTRREVAELLNARLADCIDLEAQCKQAHWNVKGPTFIALHKLFDDVHEATDEYADLIAERIVQLGGIAEGTV